MPIYVYKCPKGHVTEVFQGINSKPLETCKCGEKVQKQVSKGTSFKFVSKQ